MSTTTRAKSQRELARAVGRSAAAVNGWLKRRDWPFPRQAPKRGWDVAAVKAWAETTLSPDPAAEAADAALARVDGKPMDEMQRAKLHVLVERAAKLRLEREIRQREYVHREQVQREVSRLIHAAKAELLNLPRCITPRLPPEVEQVVMAGVRDVLDRLAEGAEHVVE